jgi:hypothetical protein
VGAWGILGFELKVLARHTFYHLSHTPNPFFALVIFHVRAYAFYCGLASGLNFFIYITHIAGITVAYHHTRLVG